MLLSSFAQAKNIAQQTVAIEQNVNIVFFILKDSFRVEFKCKVDYFFTKCKFNISIEKTPKLLNCY